MTFVLTCEKNAKTFREGVLKLSTFSGGEEHVVVDSYSDERAYLLAKITSSSELVRLILISEAIRANGTELQELRIGYFPYARQDRRCNSGEAHSMRVISSVINSLGWKKVVVVDPHSDVVEALVDNVEIIPQERIVGNYPEILELCSNEKVVLVSPDGGSLKKINKVSSAINCPVVRADKRRCISTGKIEEVLVHGYAGDDKHYLICDDICDAGGTFIMLADALQKLGAKNISLYVTHGIFSKGVGPLAPFFKNIFTTDTFYDRFVGSYNETRCFMRQITY